jgi:hypothetical protein
MHVSMKIPVSRWLSTRKTRGPESDAEEPPVVETS